MHQPDSADVIDATDLLSDAAGDATGLFLHDTAGVIRLASPGVTQLLGYPAVELIGRLLPSFVPALYRERVGKGLARALLGEAESYEEEIPVTRKDRALMQLRLRIAVIESNGQVIGALSLLDLPQRQHAEIGASGPHALMTPRQRQVASLLLEGITVQEIADRLSISVNTARMHIKNMHTATETRTLHALALWSLRHCQCCLPELAEVWDVEGDEMSAVRQYQNAGSGGLRSED